MKKVLFTVLAVVLAFSMVLTGCSGTKPAENQAAQQSDEKDNAAANNQSEDKSWEEIKQKGKFIVGLDDAFPPMGFKDEDNNIVGFDIDLAKEAAKRMGVEVEFKPVVWNTVILDLQNKNIDVIWNGLTITEERKEKIAFTKPYMEDKQILVVAKGSDIKGKADLAGKKVGLQDASSSEEALAKDEATYKSIGEIKKYTSNDEVLMDLKAGRIDAAVVDEVVGRYYISKHADDYVILEDHFGFEEFGVGVRKEDVSFLNELQKTLDEMKADGTSAEISKKWFGEDIVK